MDSYEEFWCTQCKRRQRERFVDQCGHGLEEMLQSSISFSICVHGAFLLLNILVCKILLSEFLPAKCKLALCTYIYSLCRKLPSCLMECSSWTHLWRVAGNSSFFRRCFAVFMMKAIAFLSSRRFHCFTLQINMAFFSANNFPSFSFLMLYKFLNFWIIDDKDAWYPRRFPWAREFSFWTDRREYYRIFEAGCNRPI